MKRSNYLISVLLVLTVLVTACGSTTAANPTPSTTPTTAAKIPSPTNTSVVISSPIVGTYSLTISLKDVTSKPELGPHVGKWTLTLNNDGSDRLRHTDPITDALIEVVYGTYQLSPGQVSFTDDTCVQLYGPDAATGTYNWTLQGKTLILRTKVEKCSIRQLVLTSHPWLKV
jgi:hypothetical protein